MTRVSQNSSSASLQYAVNKAKERLEDLQLKGSTLKRVGKPSDDPMSSFKGIQLRTSNLDNDQYLRNISYALNQLNTTEDTLAQLTEIMAKAKEIAIQQASDFYGNQIRENVSHEIIQLRNQALALGNKRIGNRHIFAGYNSLKTPFDSNGEYHGDKGHIQLEITKDFFLPINVHGEEVFFSNDEVKYPDNPIKDFVELPKNKENIDRTNPTPQNKRELASVSQSDGPNNSSKPDGFATRDNIFKQLTTLVVALENNDTAAIQDLLDRIDVTMQRLITMRTRLGSLVSTAQNAQQSLETEIIANKTYESKLIDADVAEVFSDLAKQQTILQTAYQTSQGLLKKTLMDFVL